MTTSTHKSQLSPSELLWSAVMQDNRNEKRSNSQDLLARVRPWRTTSAKEVHVPNIVLL